MMEHIRQFDWCTTDNDQSFIKVQDANKCVTERIIKNRFFDPLQAYDNKKPEKYTGPIDWKEVFSENGHFGGKNFRTFIPGLRPIPVYPKLSSIPGKDHYRCLRVLYAQNPHVLPAFHIPRPTKVDYTLFESLKETYETEKKEYIEWAKSLWLNGSCIKALRPKPTIEVTYEAEFKMRSNTIQSFPKEYTMAAQIPLKKDGSYEFKKKKDLINVNISELPEIYYPKIIASVFTVLRPCSMPEPCNKHPCRFILPNEKSVSNLPLTEVHRELAQYAAEQGAVAIAAENALKCLMETDRSWILPLSVCEGIRPDGEKVNITVIGSEFAIQKEPAPRRTYRALKHMLHSVFILPEEKAKMIDKTGVSSDGDQNESLNGPEITDDESDEEDNRLLIDIQGDQNEQTENKTDHNSDINEETDKQTKESTDISDSENNRLRDDAARSPVRKRPRLRSDDANDIGIFSCMCKESIFETPPPRSFKLLEVNEKNNKDVEPFSIIVHCSHKTRKGANEVLLEPIPEFLIDIAGTEHTREQQTSLALSLMLRKNASLINARIDGNIGDLVTVEEKTLSDITSDEVTQTISSTLYSVLDQFTGLVPGKYMLVHEISHGTNALLFTSGKSSGSEKLSLSSAPARDEAAQVQHAPRFAPILLPYHIYRSILPCAFSPHEAQVARAGRAAPHRLTLPPAAIQLQTQGATGKNGKYPKRKKKKGKKH